MSAAEDYRALRETRKSRGFGSIGQANSKGMKRPVVVTKCTECGKVMPYDGSKPNVCGECWEKMNGHAVSGRWNLHLEK